MGELLFVLVCIGVIVGACLLWEYLRSAQRERRQQNEYLRQIAQQNQQPDRQDSST